MNDRVNTGGIWMVAALCVAMATAAFAQGPADLPKVPILENTTCVVLKLDLNKLDGDVVTKWLVDSIDKMIADPTDKQQMVPQIQKQLGILVQAQQVMIKAKAPVVYFAFNEFPVEYGPLIYAPVAAGGDAQAVRALMFSGPTSAQKGPELAAARPGQRLTVAMPDGVFMGRFEDYQRISQPHMGAPHLLFAMAMAPATPLQVVAAPTEGLNLLLEAMMPQISAPLDLPMMAFTRGISSAVLTVQAPPDAAMHLAIQGSDAAAAAQLKTAADKMLALLNTPQMQQQAPPGVDVKAMAEALSPRVQENQLTIDLAGDKAALIPLSILMPKINNARQAAGTVQSAAVMRAILMEMIRYAQQHQNMLPESLDQLDLRAGGQFTPNPRALPGKPGWVYVPKAAMRISDVKPNEIVIYENPAALPASASIINTGFVDGHIEGMPLGALMQRLEAQGAPRPTIPGR